MKFYSDNSEFTGTSKYQEILRKVPNEIREICIFTQSLLIHAYWLDKYNFNTSDSNKFQEMQLRYLDDILDLASSRNENLSDLSRAPEERVISICRDFSLIVCAVLRTKGIPARLRCGFATYLNIGSFEDHWICEYWNVDKSKWIKVDAQLDNIHLENLNIDFDACDIPSGKFLYAGEAWELCRNLEENPSTFGIQGLSGLPFIKANIVRDIFSLRKIETLPWDSGWGIIKDPLVPITDDKELSAIDKLAEISKTSNQIKALDAINSISLSVPKNWDWSQSPTIEELIS